MNFRLDSLRRQSYAIPGRKKMPVGPGDEAIGDIPCAVIGDTIKPGKVDLATRGAYLAAMEI